MILPPIIFLFLSLLAFVRASSGSRAVEQSCRPPQPELQDQTVYQFSNGTWLENVAARANGNLLVTLLDRPELYEVNPFDLSSAKLIYSFPGYLSLLGITETRPDVFTVITGNYSAVTGGVPESWAVWKADFNHGQEAELSKVTDIPEAIFLDGMTTLDAEAGAVLVGDATKGVIFRVDTDTREYELVQRHESFVPPPGAPAAIGVNGIRTSGDHLYYVNTVNPLYGRVPISAITGEATGPYELISTGVSADDFALDEDKTAYITGGRIAHITKIKLNGESTVIARNITGTRAAVFGRTRKDEHILYVVTGTRSADGTSSEGGKILALAF